MSDSRVNDQAHSNTSTSVVEPMQHLTLGDLNQQEDSAFKASKGMVLDESEDEAAFIAILKNEKASLEEIRACADKFIESKGSEYFQKVTGMIVDISIKKEAESERIMSEADPFLSVCYSGQAKENESFILALTKNCSYSNYFETIKSFIEYYGLTHLIMILSYAKILNELDGKNHTALNFFCLHDANLIKALLESGVPISEFEKCDSLHLAIQKGQVEVACILIQGGYALEKGKNILVKLSFSDEHTIKCNCFFSPLEQVVDCEKLTFAQKSQLIDLLITKGVNLNRNMVLDESLSFLSAYSLANMTNQKRLCQYLLEKGALKAEIEIESKPIHEENAKIMRSRTRLQNRIRDFKIKENEYFKNIDEKLPPQKDKNLLKNLILKVEIGEERIRIFLNPNSFFYSKLKDTFLSGFKVALPPRLLKENQFSFRYYLDQAEIDRFHNCLLIYLNQLKNTVRELEIEAEKQKLKENDSKLSDKMNKDSRSESDGLKKEVSQEKTDQAYYESKSEKNFPNSQNQVTSNFGKKKKPKNKKNIKSKTKGKPKTKAPIINNTSHTPSSTLHLIGEKAGSKDSSEIHSKRDLPKPAALDSVDREAFEKIKDKLEKNSESEFSFFSKASPLTVLKNNVPTSTSTSDSMLKNTKPKSVNCILRDQDQIQTFVFSDYFRVNQLILSKFIVSIQGSEISELGQWNSQYYFNLFQLIDFSLQIWDEHDILNFVISRDLLRKFRECLKPDYLFSLEGESLKSFHTFMMDFKGQLIWVLNQIQNAFSEKILQLDFSQFQLSKIKDLEQYYEDKKIKEHKALAEKSDSENAFSGLGLFQNPREVNIDSYKKSIRLQIALIFIRFEGCQNVLNLLYISVNPDKNEMTNLTQEMNYLLIAMASLVGRIYKKTDADLLPLVTTANQLRHVTEDVHSAQIRDLSQDEFIFDPDHMQRSGLHRALAVLKERLSFALQQVQSKMPDRDRKLGSRN